MIFYFDIDNTICSSINRSDAVEKVSKCKPYRSMIEAVNKLHSRGHTVVLYTNRKKVCKAATLKWLEKYKVKYHKVKFDKPKYSLFVEDRSLPPYKYLTADMIEEYATKIKSWDFGKGGPKGV